MPSRRVSAALVLGVGAVVALIAVAILVLIRDETSAPRGELIAYSCQEPGNTWYAVCVMRPDGTAKRRLTQRLPTPDPAWSPDGQWIAFTRNDEFGEYTTFSDDDVFVMEADGDDPRRLTPEQEGRHAGQPTWSPDGREIAFVRGRSIHSATIGRPGDIFVMAADGTRIRRLTRGGLDSGPAWSPDGGEIAFSRRPAFTSVSGLGDDIYVVNRDGSGEVLVLAHQHFARSPYSLTWSPDGRTIAFETSPAVGCTAIALVEVDGGAARRLTSCNGSSRAALGPAWQPAAGAGGR